MQIHLITFDIPFPADYGGVIDVFYKLKTLHDHGFQVILHCFQYGNRQASEDLERLATKVYYYKRSLSLKYFFSQTPFIVASRNHKSLLDNLLQDDSPILFEGVHSTFYVNHPALANRKKIVRLHNVENQYYAQLATMENNWAKKIFFFSESKKLKIYEKQIACAKNIHFLAISDNDLRVFQQYGAAQINTCLPFHPFTKVDSKEGRGDYVLFHGNLSIKDNERAALFLIESIFSKNKIPFIIAGKKPSNNLFEKIKHFSNINIVSNPDEVAMSDLIEKAHINLLWSFQAEGIKLKLFYALFQGKFVIANKNITNNLRLNDCVIPAEISAEIIQNLDKLFSQNFDNQQLIKRKELLKNWISEQHEVLFQAFETI
jgi:hypothetical protein